MADDKALPRRSTPSSITTAFNNHLIYDHVLYRLPAASLLRLGRCSRLMRQATIDHLKSALDINKHLNRYFENPTEFRTMQARTATLISGSTALQFFDRTYYPESDLDLYAHPRHVKEVGRWLLDVEGYTFQPSIVQVDDFEIELQHRLPRLNEEVDEILRDINDAERDASAFHSHQYNIPGVSGVFTFTKATPPRKVQVIAAKRNPLECILNFYSSSVMNIIAWDAAYCLFPMATLEHHLALQTRCGLLAVEDDEDGLDPGTRAALQKYAKRGFQVSRFFDRTPENDALYMRSIIRRVNDAHSWTVQLDCAGVDPCAAPFGWDPVMKSMFKLRCLASSIQTRVTMNFRLMSSSLFKYKYLVSDASSPYYKVFVRLRYDEYGRGQYAKGLDGQPCDQQYWDGCVVVRRDLRTSECSFISSVPGSAP